MKMFMKRSIAYGLDLLIVGGINLFYAFSSKAFMLEKDTSKVLFMGLCALIVTIFAFIYLPTKWNGQTIGDKIMKIRVVNQSGKPRTYFQSFIRELLLKYTCCGIFIPLMLIYKLIDLVIHRTLKNPWPHDVLLKTDVVEEEK